jgi:hydrogenase/urease accessory protein HupE
MKVYQGLKQNEFTLMGVLKKQAPRKQVASIIARCSLLHVYNIGKQVPPLRFFLSFFIWLNELFKYITSGS